MSGATTVTTKILLEEARIVNPNYPVKGESGWFPYGYQIAKNLIDLFEGLFTEIGFEEIALPTFVKGEIFLEQCQKIKDFRRRVYWASPFVEGDNHVLKSTIEAQISSLFSVWIKQGRKPPFKFFTCRSVGRYETGKTIPLWKERNVWPFFEAHSAHENENDLLVTIEKEIEVLRKGFSAINLPIFIVERPKVNKRLEEYSEKRIEAITIMPTREAAILSSIYDLGNIFSRVFSVMSEQGKLYPMVNFAFSGRVLGTLFALHSDNYGLKLPLSLAPVLIRLIPLEPNNEPQLSCANDLASSLQELGYRVDLDDSLQNLGKRISFARCQGVPLTVLIGPKELAASTLTIIKRDDGKELTIPKEKATNQFKILLSEYSNNLSNSASDLVNHLYKQANSYESLDSLGKENYLIEAPMCSDIKCLERSCGGKNSEIIGSLVDKKPKDREVCIICKSEATQLVLFGNKWKGEK